MPTPSELPNRGGGDDGGDEPAILPEIYALRPWYHDFGRLGLRTDFGERGSLRQRLRRTAARVATWTRRSGSPTSATSATSTDTTRFVGPSSHRVNQRVKESLLLPWIEDCLRQLGDGPRCLDLFCADGFYSCAMAQQSPEAEVVGVDREAGEIERARAAARALGLDRTRFVVADVYDFAAAAAAADDCFDLVLCAGGLYHLTEPWKILSEARRLGQRHLVVQSVVTLESEAPDYFVSPAPRWRHGSRFTHARLRSWLGEAGWRTVGEARAELPGNLRTSDRGSSFFLCEAAAPRG